MTRSAALSILPWGVNVVCTNLAGWLGDKAINERGVDRTLVRKVMQGIASLGPAVCLLALASDQGAPLTACRLLMVERTRHWDFLIPPVMLSPYVVCKQADPALLFSSEMQLLHCGFSALML